MDKRYILGMLTIFVLTTLVFGYLTYTSNRPIRIKLEISDLKINDDSDISSLEISEESFIKLKNVINENMIIKDQDKIIDLFNKERSNYISLITILATLLTMFSLFTIISSFVEKNNIEKISSKMKDKVEEYDIQLKKINYNTLRDWINKENKKFSNPNIKFQLDEHTAVSDYQTFLKSIDIVTNNFFKYIKDKVEWQPQLGHFFLGHKIPIFYRSHIT